MTPYFQTVQDFIHMNGHGSYVWSSYVISFLCIFGLIWYVFAERKKMLTTLTKQNTRLTNKQRQERSQTALKGNV